MNESLKPARQELREEHKNDTKEQIHSQEIDMAAGEIADTARAALERYEGDLTEEDKEKIWALARKKSEETT